MKKTIGVALVVVLAACGSDPPAPTSLSCPQTVDAFCANASPKCARSVDPNDVSTSFCAGTSPGTYFGFAVCPNNTVDVDVADQTWFYDATSHQLVAIVSNAGNCIAGPATFPKPTESCIGSSVGYKCGGTPPDGGSDAKPD